jgi:hypothetical protein
MFIREEEIVHAKQDTLQFCVIVHVLEVHNFSTPESSDSESWELRLH